MAKKTSVLSPTAMLRHNALYKGLLGGRRGWMAVGALLWGPRLLKRLMGREEQTLTTERLKPGESVTITAICPPSRSQRKAAARAR